MVRRALLLLACVAIALSLLLGVGYLLVLCPGTYDRSAPYQLRTFKGPACEVRVAACSEELPALAVGLPGAGFFFESRREGDAAWRPVMEFRHDDRVPILEGSVRHFGEKVVVVFMGWRCAVSGNGAASWNLWSAESDLPFWAEKENTNDQYIQEVQVGPDGSGVMTLNPLRWTQLRSLRTRDFGKTWSP